MNFASDISTFDLVKKGVTEVNPKNVGLWTNVNKTTSKTIQLEYQHILKYLMSEVTTFTVIILNHLHLI